MTPFTHHIFVCCNHRDSGHPRGCCDPDGDGSLKKAFKEAIARRKLRAQVRANLAGCLDQCELGPTVVIYPAGIWYGKVSLTDVERILDETVLAGKIIDELLISDEMLNTKGKGPPCIPRHADPSAEQNP
ncbi:MAG: (2Fe-2S) ferredoxin domain-containing protein [Planctomycetaceae bacterium]|nr:(2Fe-2S) ferredoxin domain-containing protein [Planctomycetaceae bacterium]